METPSRHEPFEPPTMAKRAARYPSLLPSLPPASFLCPSLHLSSSPSIHTALFGCKPQKSGEIPAHATLLPTFSAVCSRSLFLEKSSCSRHSCWLHHNGPEQLLPSGSCRTHSINLVKAGHETVTLKQHCPGSLGLSWLLEVRGCVGDTEPTLAVLPTGPGSRRVQLHQLKVGCREPGIENLQTRFLSLFFPPTAADDTLLLE